MVYFGEGSDWNPETDGEPICICEMDGNVEELVEQEQEYEQQILAEPKAPATGEPAMVEILGTVVMLLIVIIAVCGVNRRGGTTWE